MLAHHRVCVSVEREGRCESVHSRGASLIMSVQMGFPVTEWSRGLLVTASYTPLWSAAIAGLNTDSKI